MSLLRINLNNEAYVEKNFSSMSKQIREALENDGCFLVEYDDIGTELRGYLYELIEKLLNLPVEVQKNVLQFPGSILQLLGQKNPDSPNHSSMGFCGADDAELTMKFLKLMFPNENTETYCDTVITSFMKLKKLYQSIVRLILHAYLVDDQYHAFMEATQFPRWLVIKYVPPMSDELVTGPVDHVDTTYLTLLGHNDVKGLYIKSRTGEWKVVDQEKNSIAVLGGFSIKVWSNGKIHAPLHKVEYKGDKPRLTFGMFAQPNNDQIIEVNDGLVDDQYPRRYKPFVFEEFIKYYMLRKSVPELVDEYAGIKINS